MSSGSGGGPGCVEIVDLTEDGFSDSASSRDLDVTSQNQSCRQASSSSSSSSTRRPRPRRPANHISDNINPNTSQQNSNQNQQQQQPQQDDEGDAEDDVEIVLDDTPERDVIRLANRNRRRGPNPIQPAIINVDDDDNDIIDVQSPFRPAFHNSARRLHFPPGMPFRPRRLSRRDPNYPYGGRILFPLDGYVSSGSDDDTRVMNPAATHEPQKRPETPTNDLKCPICIESYKNIKKNDLSKIVVTRCGHMFCDNCLKKAITENGRHCPKCRKNIPRGQTSIIEVFDVA